MGLQISAKKRVGYKIASLVAIFAFVVSPLCGVVDYAASAASDTSAPTEVIAKSDIDGKSVKSPQGYDITFSAKDYTG